MTNKSSLKSFLLGPTYAWYQFLKCQSSTDLNYDIIFHPSYPILLLHDKNYQYYFLSLVNLDISINF